MGHHVLGLGRMLGRAVDEDVVVLTGNREGDLAFEIHMILPADRDGAVDAARRGGQSGVHLAAFERQRRCHIRIARFPGREGIEREGQVLAIDLGKNSRPARRVPRLGDHRKEGLAVKLDFVRRKDRLVMLAGRADVVDAGNVLGGQDLDDAGRGPHGGQVETKNTGMGDGRQAEIGVKRAFRLGNVVGVVGAAGDMLGGAVMDTIAVDGAGNRRLVITEGHR